MGDASLRHGSGEPIAGIIDGLWERKIDLSFEPSASTNWSETLVGSFPSGKHRSNPPAADDPVMLSEVKHPEHQQA